MHTSNEVMMVVMKVLAWGAKPGPRLRARSAVTTVAIWATWHKQMPAQVRAQAAQRWSSVNQVRTSGLCHC